MASQNCHLEAAGLKCAWQMLVHIRSRRCGAPTSAAPQRRARKAKESTAVRRVQNRGQGQQGTCPRISFSTLPSHQLSTRLHPAPSLSVKWATDTIWTEKQINITRHVTVTHPLWEPMPAVDPACVRDFLAAARVRARHSRKENARASVPDRAVASGFPLGLRHQVQHCGKKRKTPSHSF